jgi:lysophospholipase L1-like esterase
MLFVSHSLVQNSPGGITANRIPEQVKTMAELAGREFTYVMTNIGGGSLEDHWNDTTGINARDEIANGNYDVVSLNSSTDPAETNASFNTHADLLSDLAHANGSAVMFYGIWASDLQISISGGNPVGDARHQLYRSAATRNDAAYSPNGKAMEEAHRQLTQVYGNGDNGITAEAMLTADNIHPTALGAYLMANTLYWTLFDAAPPAASVWRPDGVSLADAQRMQTIAASVVNSFGLLLEDALHGGGNGGGGTDPGTGSIAGRYFLDADGDGVEDAGEDGIAGVTVSLLQGGTVIATDTTDANGGYGFAALDGGSYVVQFAAPPANHVFSPANVGSDATDSDVTNVQGSGAGRTATITLAAGGTVSNVDAGARPAGGGGGTGEDPEIRVIDPGDYAQALDGTSANQTISGGSSSDYITAKGGNDRLNGYAGNDYLDGGTGIDSLYGGNNDDIFLFDEGDATINGGSGVDVVLFRDGGTVSATGVGFNSVEVLDLVNGLDDDLTVTATQVRSARNAEMRIMGEGDDALRLSGSNTVTFLGTVTEGGQDYDRYRIGSTVFGIDADIDFYVNGLLV